MNNRKGIMAIEGLEVLPEAPLPALDVSQIDTDVASIQNGVDQLAEAEGISETVDTIVGGLETAVVQGEGVNEVTADITNAALEHFYARVGYTSKPGKPVLSLEGYADPKARLKNTQVALENLKKFQDRLGQSIALTQEGLLESMSNRVESSSKQLDDILASLSKVSKAYDSKGAKDGMVDGGKWAAPFGAFDKNMVPSSDVLERLKKVETAFKKIDPAAIIEEMCKVVGDLTVEMTKEKGQVDSYDSLGKKLNLLNRGADAIKNIMKGAGDKKSNVDGFAPLSADDKRELVTVVKFIAGELDAFSSAWGKLEEKIEYLKQVADKAEKSEATAGKDGEVPIRGRVIGALLGMFVFGVGALAGFLIGWVVDRDNVKKGSGGSQEAAYKNQAGATKNQARENMSTILELDAELVKLCYAAVTYVEKSTA